MPSWLCTSSAGCTSSGSTSRWCLKQLTKQTTKRWWMASRLTSWNRSHMHHLWSPWSTHVHHLWTTTHLHHEWWHTMHALWHTLRHTLWHTCWSSTLGLLSSLSTSTSTTARCLNLWWLLNHMDSLHLFFNIFIEFVAIFEEFSFIQDSHLVRWNFDLLIFSKHLPQILNQNFMRQIQLTFRIVNFLELYFNVS